MYSYVYLYAMSTEERSKIVSTRVTPATHRALRLLAAHQDRRLADLVDEAIQAYLERSDVKGVPA